MNRRFGAALFALLLVFAACGDDDSASTTAVADTMAEDMDMADDTMAEDMDMADEDHMEEFAFGDPMEGATADRVIEITANDDFSFSPASVTVSAGETVTFRVTNGGAIPHDFVLGDSHLQEEHEAEMAAMADGMMAHDDPNVFSLAPGETKEMTWHLTEPGGIIFGCHQVGHYAAGMLGTVTVEG